MRKKKISPVLEGYFRSYKKEPNYEIAFDIMKKIQTMDDEYLWLLRASEFLAMPDGLIFRISCRWKGYVHIKYDHECDLYHVEFHCPWKGSMEWHGSYPHFPYAIDTGERCTLKEALGAIRSKSATLVARGYRLRG